MASKRTIDILRDTITTDYFTDSAIRSILPDVVGLRGKVFRLIESGDIVRLKRGFYIFNNSHNQSSKIATSHKVFSPNLSQLTTAPLNVFGIANALYGPSYVSLESALSYHGLIPEGVVDITSVNINRTKSFSTPIGNFTYRIICKSAFPKGVVQAGGATSRFLIATPEKALLDKLYLDAGTEELLDYSTASLRIETSDLAKLNLEAISSLSAYYECKKFSKKLLKLIKALRSQSAEWPEDQSGEINQ